ncbi:hypothetical protein CYY_001316 [Polysphondylium violaceum]|uniref:Pleckstrin domain-containing protein n=1 Tax=Polysphondylium violaceum TaxID=133409 RepID=A0A8J4PYE2_9MYCE|nr:hypothetical protein CYY_001316 [Polysphondylium violaceum]
MDNSSAEEIDKRKTAPPINSSFVNRPPSGSVSVKPPIQQRGSHIISSNSSSSISGGSSTLSKGNNDSSNAASPNSTKRSVSMIVSSDGHPGSPSSSSPQISGMKPPMTNGNGSSLNLSKTNSSENLNNTAAAASNTTNGTGSPPVGYQPKLVPRSSINLKPSTTTATVTSSDNGTAATTHSTAAINDAESDVSSNFFADSESTSSTPEDMSMMDNHEDSDDETDEEEEEMHDKFLKEMGLNKNEINDLKETERKEMELLAGGTRFRVTRCFVGVNNNNPTSPNNRLTTTFGSGSPSTTPSAPPPTTSNSKLPPKTTTTTTTTPLPSTNGRALPTAPISSAPGAKPPTGPRLNKPPLNAASTTISTPTLVSSSLQSPPSQQQQQMSTQSKRKTIMMNNPRISLMIHQRVPPKKPLPPVPPRSKPMPNYSTNQVAVDAIIKIQKAYRRHKECLPFIKLKLLYRYRWNIIQEIYNTEKTYLATLRQLSTHFIEPLRKGAIIGQEDVKFIFGGIDTIMAINSRLMSDIEDVLANWNPYSIIGVCFTTLGVFLKAYTDYVKNFDFALQRIGLCGKDSKFSTFIKSAEEKTVPRSRLESLLITPVQRIPRYVLLLQDLLKHTEESHPDYSHIVKALDLIKSVAMSINDTKRQSDNSLKVVEVQNKLLGKCPNLVIAERRYIYEGYLLVGDTFAKSKRVYVFLFNDILIFSKPSTTKIFNAKSNVKFKFLKCEDLFPTPQVTDIPNNPLYQNCFEILLQSVELRFFGESLESKAIWLKHLQKVFNDIGTQNEKNEKLVNYKKAEEKANDFKKYVGAQYAVLKMKSTTDLNSELGTTTTGNENGTNNSQSGDQQQQQQQQPQMRQYPTIYTRQTTFHKMSYETRQETIKIAEEKMKQLELENQKQQLSPDTKPSTPTNNSSPPPKGADVFSKSATVGRSSFFKRDVSSSFNDDSVVVDVKSTKPHISAPSLNKIFQMTGVNSEKELNQEKDKDKDKDRKKTISSKSSLNLKALNSELATSLNKK